VTKAEIEHSLTAIAIVEARQQAHQQDDHSDLARLLGWFDVPEARGVIKALAELVVLAGQIITDDPEDIGDLLKAARLMVLHNLTAETP
jgi:hypothetical protein